jgi:hypothetical protein
MGMTSIDQNPNREMVIKEWLSSHEEELIECPYQMGSVKITRSSCRKRRQKAQNMITHIDHSSYFEYALEQSLILCKQCDQYFLADIPSFSEGPLSVQEARRRKSFRHRRSHGEGVIGRVN